MKSSAMRDLMAVTARPEVISLAGGLPDTSTFPAEDFTALMTRVGVDDTARALQYGPTEGLDEAKGPIVEVMAAEGMEVEPDDLLVTTGGQQVIDLVCKTLIDPGDVVIAEAPTYPGAVPSFVSYQADVVQIEMDEDGMRIDVLEAELARLDAAGPLAEVHLHDPVVPEPGRRDDVARAPAPAGRDRAPARAARARGQPVRDAALRGRAAADAVLARRRRVRDLPRHVLEDPLARAAARLDRGAAARCSTSSTSARAPPTSAPRRCRSCSCGPTSPSATGSRTSAQLTDLYRRRRDIMLEALAEHFPREATWTRPQGGLFIWARLPDFIDTTDLLARALREHVAFVPGRAAYLDGRGGSEMRLNFSGVERRRHPRGRSGGSARSSASRSRSTAR